MIFTDKFLKNIKPKSKRYDLRENSGKGFTLRVNPSGSLTFLFIYKIHKIKYRMTLGNYPLMSLSEARKAHRDALNLVDEGKNPAKSKQLNRQETRAALTVAQLAEEYIEKWSKPRKRSWKKDQQMLDKDVIPIIGDYKAKDITRRDIILLIEKIVARKAPITANRTLACLRRMFNFGIERDILNSNPCYLVKAQSKEVRRDRCLTSEEIKKFWQDLDHAPVTRLVRLALKLQLITAQRIGEVASAEWNEIDLSDKWWNIPSEKSKNGQSHRVPLSEQAMEILIQLKSINSGSPWLFPSPTSDYHIQLTAPSRAIRNSYKANLFNGIESFTPHDLRRTAASHMTGMGISRLTVSKILNHADNSVTAIYDRHSYDTEKKNALAAWGNQLDVIIQDNAKIESKKGNNVINFTK